MILNKRKKVENLELKKKKISKTTININNGDMLS